MFVTSEQWGDVTGGGGVNVMAGVRGGEREWGVYSSGGGGGSFFFFLFF